MSKRISFEKLFNWELRENYDQDDAIPFKKWQTTDRSNLEEVELHFYDVSDEICDQIRNLTVHHFIAESQNKYFKYAKDNLSEDECVTVLDFADIYSFIVQDAVQGFHWNSSQPTIHPFVIYYVLQKVVLEYLKEKLPMLKKMISFSEGCGGQYKN